MEEVQQLPREHKQQKHMRFFDFQRPTQRFTSIAQALSSVGVVVVLLLPFLPNTATSAGIETSTIIARTNDVRLRSGLRPLHADPLLAAAAQQRAEELVAGAFFDHVRPNGRPFASAAAEAGYLYERVAENLAIDFVNESPIVSAWLKSPSHRRNILGAGYRDIGIGTASGVVRGIPTTIVVQLVGVPRNPAFRDWVRLPSALPIG